MTLRLGRYETLRQIASGGMATVHLARVTGEGGFQRLVALKLMHPHLMEDQEFVSMFLDEGRLAASIRHPNVVATVDIDRTDEGMFLVMEYVDGTTLRKLIARQRKRGGPMPLPVVLRIFLDLLEGLGAAHELRGAEGRLLNLIHRDISPSNVLVGRDGMARITDFGVARAEARLTATRGGELKGKVPYMSPEQLQGGEIDQRCDLYAAGCVLWEMLVLRRLFSADDQGALIGTVLAGPKKSPCEAAGHVPYNLDRACMRALEGLEDRYRTAASFARALRDAAERDGVVVASRQDLGAYVDALVPPRAVDQPSHSGRLASGSHSSSSSAASASDIPSGSASSSWIPSHPSASTAASLVATPSRSLRKRHGGPLTLVVALLASLLGGTIVWVATEKAAGDAQVAPSLQVPGAPATAAATDEPLADTRAGGPSIEDPESPSAVASGAPSSAPAASASASASTGRVAVRRHPPPRATRRPPKPRPKHTATRKPPAPRPTATAPKPASTGGFRPSHP